MTGHDSLESDHYFAFPEHPDTLRREVVRKVLSGVYDAGVADGIDFIAMQVVNLISFRTSGRSS